MLKAGDLPSRSFPELCAVPIALLEGAQLGVRVVDQLIKSSPAVLASFYRSPAESCNMFVLVVYLFQAIVLDEWGDCKDIAGEDGGRKTCE